jgi:signal peptidase I
MQVPVVRKKKEQSAAGSLIELVTIVAVALGLALGIQAFLVKPFRIPSESMVPTLDVGQRVLVNRIGLRFDTPDRGDIVVFKPPKGADDNFGGRECGANHPDDSACPRPTPERSDTNFIKRVVAIGGDRLKVVRGRVYINGRPRKEPYARLDAGCDVCNLPREITIPKGYYFMMGDNRGESQDSRYWGPIPKKWMIGSAFATYWPPRRVGVL